MAEGLALPYTFFAGGDSPDFAAQQNFQTIVTFINRRLLGATDMIYVIKAADETVTNSTTLQDDDELFFTTTANSIYAFQAFLVARSASSTPDFKFQWIEPDGTFDVQWLTGAGNFTLSETSSATVVAVTAGASEVCSFTGTIRAGAAGGIFKLQWAQNTVDAVNGIILESGSWLAYRRL